MLISYVLLGKIPKNPTLLKKRVPFDTRRILGYFYDSSVDLHLKVAFKSAIHKEMVERELVERTFMVVPVGEECDMSSNTWVYIGSASGTFLFMKIMGASDAKYWKFIPDI